MSFEEETDLRELLAQTLETNGCLSKIRAQLRASVFLALNEDSNLNKQQPLLNNKIKTFLDNPDGRLMFCIVREFLEYFNLDYTISVYEPETYMNNGYKYEGRQKILDDLGLESLQCPLLLELIKLARMRTKTLDINLNFNGNSDRDEDEKDIKTGSQISTSISVDLTHDDNENSVGNSVNKLQLNGTYVVGKSNSGSVTDHSKSSEEGDSSHTNNSSLGDESTTTNGSDEKIKTKTDKSKSKDTSPSQLSSKSRVSDILPSLYSKEFKEKANLKELEKLFDMETEYEEDFMSGSEIELSLQQSKIDINEKLNKSPPDNSDINLETLKIHSKDKF